MNQKEIEQYLIDFQKKKLPTGIERELKVHPQEKIKVIMGPRRAGKSFFLYQTMDKLKKNNKNILYFNFENTKLFEVNFKDIKEIISLNERIFPQQKNPTLFFDEPQNIDLWERAVRELFDEKYNIFISGSSSKLLSKEIYTSLRGRSISYLLLPFSFKEFLRTKNFNYSKNLTSEEKINLLVFLDEYLEFGGFPEIVLENNKELKIKNIESYFDLTVYKDIIERHKIKDAILVKWFLKSVASCYSNELSINKIYLTLKSQGRKVSKDELYNYASIIEDSFFAFYLPKFSHSVRKREPVNKVYLCDIGFNKLIEITEDRGKKMENIVFLELQRRKIPAVELFYWKNVQQEEVDFVIKEKFQIKELIQVCRDINNPETKQREIRALLKAGQELKCSNLLIITDNYESNEEIEWFNQKAKIRFIPIWKWLIENEYK
jgi:predicted AAA+ superfamily ATPase